MGDFERNKIELELKTFTSKNFEDPSNCKNLGQIRFYISELCSKIQEFDRRFNYVPNWAYSLLAQYNAKQSGMVTPEITEVYK